MTKRKEPDSSEMREHYDFSGGVRGKYVGRIRRAGRVVMLDPDVAKLFPDSQSVNHALRTLASVIPRARRSRKR